VPAPCLRAIPSINFTSNLRNHGVESALVAFMNGKFASGELNVGGGIRETLKMVSWKILRWPALRRL
jgi:hypothetical protein